MTTVENLQLQLSNIESRLHEVTSSYEDLDKRQDSIESSLKTTMQTSDQIKVIKNGFESLNTNLCNSFSDSPMCKLEPFVSDKDDFNIFYIRFADRVNTSQWSDERAKSELLNALRTTTCERVIKSRKITLWTWRSLLEECRNRLCTKLTQPQLETELHELEPDENESPDQVMSRIEDVINRRDQESVDENTKDNLQAVTFLRLIHIHKIRQLIKVTSFGQNEKCNRIQDLQTVAVLCYVSVERF